MTRTSRASCATCNVPGGRPSVIGKGTNSPCTVHSCCSVSPSLTRRMSGHVRRFRRLIAHDRRYKLGIVVSFIPGRITQRCRSLTGPTNMGSLNRGSRYSRSFGPRGGFCCVPKRGLTNRVSLCSPRRKGCRRVPTGTAKGSHFST